RTIRESTTRCPAAVSSWRMSAPLVSVSAVFVSETVSTKQPTVVGAVFLCSSGVDVRSGLTHRPNTRDRGSRRCAAPARAPRRRAGLAGSAGCSRGSRSRRRRRQCQEHGGLYGVAGGPPFPAGGGG